MRTIGAVLAAVAVTAISACASRGAQQPTARAAPPQSPIATQHPYEMNGKVQSVGGGLLGMGRSVSIAREDAPPAVLRVAEETRITIEGRASKLADLRPGDDVRAVFDFDESTPVALEIEAKRDR